MEELHDDELIIIAQKVAKYGTQHLISFMRTSKTHAKISQMHDVLRVLPPDYVDFLNTNKIIPQKQNFLNMMIESGHADYCVMCGVSLLYKLDPDVAEIRRVLKIASAAGSEAADYFMMLLDASAEGGEDVDRSISSFTRFFRAQKLGELHLRKFVWRVPIWMRASPSRWDRPMPKGLVLRILCSSKDTCKGDGRLPGFNWPPPGEDHEYSQTEVCILCRFDSELRGFLRDFDFGPMSYGL